MLAAFETNTEPALTIDHPKPAPRTAPIPKPRHVAPKQEKCINKPTTEEAKNKPPEVVGVILKSPAIKSPSDSLSKERGLQIWSSLLSLDKSVEDEILSLYSSDGEAFCKKLPSEDGVSTTSSLMYHHESTNEDTSIDDVNVEMFENTRKTRNSTGFKENRSATSLKSVDSIPAFLGAGNMKKWTNFEDLDELSDVSGTVSKWEVGDTTDTGMFQFLILTPNCFRLLCLYCFFVISNVYITIIFS